MFRLAVLTTISLALYLGLAIVKIGGRAGSFRTLR